MSVRKKWKNNLNFLIFERKIRFIQYFSKQFVWKKFFVNFFLKINQFLSTFFPRPCFNWTSGLFLYLHSSTHWWCNYGGPNCASKSGASRFNEIPCVHLLTFLSLSLPSYSLPIYRACIYGIFCIRIKSLRLFFGVCVVSCNILDGISEEKKEDLRQVDMVHILYMNS